MTRPLQWPPSLWAAATPEGPAWPALDTSISTDVAVIGAGFTGLSVALGRELARAVTGTPDNQLALPFTEPRPLALHGLARRIAPLMLLLYRYRDAREIAG